MPPLLKWEKRPYQSEFVEILPSISPTSFTLNSVAAGVNGQYGERNQGEENVESDKVTIIGSGYDEKIFSNKNYEKDKVINITYAGKICESKGIKSLINSLDNLDYHKDSIVVNIAGSGSDKEECIYKFFFDFIYHIFCKFFISCTFIRHNITHTYNWKR